MKPYVKGDFLAIAKTDSTVQWVRFDLDEPFCGETDHRHHRWSALIYRRAEIPHMQITRQPSPSHIWNQIDKPRGVGSVEEDLGDHRTRRIKLPNRQFTTLHSGGGFFESPRWHDGRWFVSDFYKHQVLSIEEDGSVHFEMHVENQPSGIGWLPDGSMLVVSMKDHCILRKAFDGSVSVHARLGQYCRGPLNDLVVDGEGNAWVGDFGFDLMSFQDPSSTNLILIRPNRETVVVADQMQFPNGMVIKDGNTLVVGETLGCRYTAFDINEDGTLSNRRVFAQLAPTPKLGTFTEVLPQITVAPDGCTMDANGNIWMADALGNRLLHIEAGGAILEEVRAPEGLGFFACMLGGSDGKTLLACAAPDFMEANRILSDDAVLLVTKVETPHGGRP